MKTLKINIALFILFAFATFDETKSEKILMIPYFHTAHVNFFANAGEALAEHGHEVTIVTHPRNRKVLNRKGVQELYTKDQEIFVDSDKFQNQIFNSSFTQILKPFIAMIGGFCETVLSDVELIKQLRNKNFDLAIVEGDIPGYCLYAIPYKLDLSYISMAAIMDPWTMRVAALPSVEPLPLSANTNEMGFFERVTNTITYVMFHCILPQVIAYNHNHIVSKYVPEKPKMDLRDLHQRSQLWLINWEPYILDYPRVSTPYFHYVGGIGTKPAKPLPDDLEAFVQRNKNGCIVLTFGSGIKSIPTAILHRFLYVFGRIDFNVVLTHKGELPNDVPANVKIQSWLPQNDILGHPKTRLFITHGGNNGQLEALYHGVPQIVFPVASDQTYNAMRVEKKGFGLRMDVNRFTAEELLNNVKEMTSNEKYKKNAMRASKIYRSLPSPKDKIIFWVDHVLRFGGDHLRPPYINMPFYKFFLLDVLVFVIAVLVFLFFVIRISCRFCCRLCKKTIKDKID